MTIKAVIQIFNPLVPSILIGCHFSSGAGSLASGSRGAGSQAYSGATLITLGFRTGLSSVGSLPLSSVILSSIKGPIPCP